MIVSRFIEKEWEEKRKEILLRDNFTCQICNTFNPQVGIVELETFDKMFIELHEYESSPNNSTYKISSSKTRLNIEIDFDDNWLVLPVLQIHHKRYVEGKENWDYLNEDLVTLCKLCHTVLHNTQEIPHFDSSNKIVCYKKHIPNEDYSGHNHNYKPWRFIRKGNNNTEYEVTSVSPRVTYIAFAHEDSNALKETALKMVEEFFKRFLPDYHI